MMDVRRGFVIVFNPGAGRGRAHEALRLVTTRVDGRIAPVVETNTADTFPRVLREWVRHVRGETGLSPTAVAVGGDGTVSLLLNALESPQDALVAVMPCGSGNDFAQAIGCSDQSIALETLERGAPRLIDIGVVNGRRFANCVGMGLDAEVGALAARLRRRGYPSGPSYYAAALAGLFMVKAVGIQVTADGGLRRYENGVMVTVGNGPLYGGGFRGAPDARLDDGLLDCFAFSNVSGVFRRLALMRRIRAGIHSGDANVVFSRVRSLIVEFDRDVAMHVDGEIASVRRADISVAAGALQVLSPAR